MFKYFSCITILICIALTLLISCNERSNSFTSNKKARIHVLSDQINENPGNIDLLLERADYYKRENNWDLVLFDIKQCLSIDSQHVKANFLAGKAYFEISKKNHKKKAYPYLSLEHLNKTIKYDNKNTEALLLQSRVLIAFSKYNEAMNSINMALKLNYNLEEGHLLMGYIFKILENKEEAINCFRNSIQVNPDYTEGYIQLARIYHDRDDTLAINYYNNALKINPEDLNVLYAKAVFFQTRKDWNSALKAYSDLHKIAPFHADSHYNIGFIHMELDLFNIATNNFSDAIYTNPNYYEAYYSRGFCFEKLGNIAQAESDYRRAIAINPNHEFSVEALKKLEENNNRFKIQ